MNNAETSLNSKKIISFGDESNSSMYKIKYSGLDYRSDIDGLRAISIISVVLFHSFPNIFKFGFLGVDVFFVISGFLITGIIYKNLEANKFTFRDFWSRRICRILPTFLLVICAVFIFGYFYLLENEFDILKSNIKYALVFLINFKLANEVGYFDTAAIYKPLLHIWSLSVEEQFYFIWPFLIFLLFKLRLNMILSIFFLMSIIFSIHIFYSFDQTKEFYLPDFRFWEIQVGALVFFIKEKYKLSRILGNILRFFNIYNNDILIGIIRNSISIIGFLLIIYSFFYFKKLLLFSNNLLPVVGSALIIISGPNSFVSQNFLSRSFMRFIGIISFPLYLWHYLILSFLHILYKNPTRIDIIGAIIISLILSLLTYVGVERYFRSGSKHSIRKKSLILILFTLFFLIFLNYFNISARHSSVKSRIISNAINAWEYPTKSMKKKSIGNINYYEIDTNIPKFVLFIGDSHMEYYAPYVEKLSQSNPNNVLSSIWVTNSTTLPNGTACSTWPEANPRDPDHPVDMSKCEAFITNNELLSKIQKIVISQKYHTRLRNNQYVTAPIQPIVQQLFKNFLLKIKSSGKEVIVLLEGPAYFGSIRPSISVQNGHSFRLNPAIHFGKTATEFAV